MTLRKRNFRRPRQHGGHMYQIDMDSFNCMHENFVNSLEKPILLRRSCSENKLMSEYTKQDNFDENLQKCYEKAKGTTKPLVSIDTLLPDCANVEGDLYAPNSNTELYLNRELLHEVLSQIPNVRDVYNPNLLLQGYYCRDGKTALRKNVKKTKLNIGKKKASNQSSASKVLICCPRSVRSDEDKSSDSHRIYNVNYDNLYAKLIPFFERTCDSNTLENIYKKCCGPLMLKSNVPNPYRLDGDNNQMRSKRGSQISQGGTSAAGKGDTGGDGTGEDGGGKGEKYGTDGGKKYGKKVRVEDSSEKGRKSGADNVSEGSKKGPKSGTDKNKADEKGGEVPTDSTGKGSKKAPKSGTDDNKSDGKGGLVPTESTKKVSKKAPKSGTDASKSDGKGGGEPADSKGKGSKKGPKSGSTEDTTGKQKDKTGDKNKVGDEIGHDASKGDANKWRPSDYTDDKEKSNKDKSEGSEKNKTGKEGKGTHNEDDSKEKTKKLFKEDANMDDLLHYKKKSVDSYKHRSRELIWSKMKLDTQNESAKGGGDAEGESEGEGEAEGEMAWPAEGLEDIVEKYLKKNIEETKQLKKKPKKKKKPKPKPKPEIIEEPEEPPKPHCPCPICKFMKRRQLEPDTPLIKTLKEEQEKRNLKIYYMKMKIAEGDPCSRKPVNAPQHKVDTITCPSNAFCTDRSITQCMDCLKSLEYLQNFLEDDKNQIKNCCLLLELKKIKQKLSSNQAKNCPSCQMLCGA